MPARVARLRIEGPSSGEEETEEREPAHEARLRTYGLSSAEFDELKRRSGGRCEVCSAPFREDRLGRDGMRIDHRHDNGAVRGAVCSRCNRDLATIDLPRARLRRLVEFAARHAPPGAPRLVVR